MIDKRTCYLCSGGVFKKRKGMVRDNAELDILECINCGLVFLSSFSHIHDGFYRDSNMHNPDNKIEEWVKETRDDDYRRYVMLKGLIRNKSVLDVGCGTAGFLKQAKKIASRIQGVEPESRLKTYFKKEKIPVVAELEELDRTFDVITLFHVLEHVADPISFLKKLSVRLKRKGNIIIEVPNARDALISLYGCEAFLKFTYWSCHLFIYTEPTLSKIAEKAGLKLNHSKQIQRYSLANHLYWLSMGRPGGHKEWAFLNSNELCKAYEKQLASISCCDTIVASFST